jgi:hypothetical protein
LVRFSVARMTSSLMDAQPSRLTGSTVAVGVAAGNGAVA